MFVLDTDTLTLLQYGHEQIGKRLREIEQVVVTTAITRIEILQGRFASVIKAETPERLLTAYQRLEQTEIFLQRLLLLKIDSKTAGLFGQLKENKKLKKIGRADLLIAAATLANNATLVTRNLRHFHQVPALKTENWAV